MISRIVARKQLAELGIPETVCEYTFTAPAKVKQIFAWIAKHQQYLSFTTPTVDCVFLRFERNLKDIDGVRPWTKSGGALTQHSVEQEIYALSNPAELGIFVPYEAEPLSINLNVEAGKATLTVVIGVIVDYVRLPKARS